MYCTECGAPLKPGDRFCSTCGTPTADMETADLQSDDIIVSPAASVLSKEQVRPWIRYWARMFDIYIFALLAGTLIAVIGLDVFSAPGLEQLSGMLILFTWIFVESILLTSFGTTPGKWLFRIHLIPPDDDFTCSEAFVRSLKVWFRGIGMGIPLVGLVTLIVAYYRLKENSKTSWDREGEILVQHEKIGIVRILAAILFFTGFIGIMIMGSINANA